MNKKKKLFNCSFFYVEAVNQYGFEYGNLANLHPSETFPASTTAGKIHIFTFVFDSDTNMYDTTFKIQV